MHFGGPFNKKELKSNNMSDNSPLSFDKVNEELQELYGSPVPYLSPQEKLMIFISNVLSSLMKNNKDFLELNKTLIKKFPALNIGLNHRSKDHEIIEMVNRFVLLAKENDYSSLECAKAKAYLRFMSEESTK
jgi:hypothetical protein